MEILIRADEFVLAQAYQADRVRRGANSLAGWTVAYLKSRQYNHARDVAAREFTEGAVTLAGFLILNEIEIGSGDWKPQARAGVALAWDVVGAMSIPPDSIASAEPGRGLTLDECRTFAASHATIELARACLEVCRLIPRPFHGPDEDIHREKARLVWRRFHGVTEPPPASADELLTAALDCIRVDDNSAGMDAARPTLAAPAPAVGYEERATAAAYALLREGKRVSIKAVCDRADLDRSHLMKRYPKAVAIIKQIGAPTRDLRRGSKTRDGQIEAADDGEE